MTKKAIFISFVFLLILTSCAFMQSVVKSTFPYTTTVIIPRSSPVGVETSVTGVATSFDQSFKKDGNNANKVSEVRITSAKLQSEDPTDFNIGNLTSIKVYMARADGTEEVLVASRTDITPRVGNTLVLDIDNSSFLDKHVREQQIKVRMAYTLRNHIDVNANMHLILALGASPAN